MQGWGQPQSEGQGLQSHVMNIISHSPEWVGYAN